MSGTADASPLDQPAPRSAGLTLNLSSNNPFRNRTASPPGPQSPASPFNDPNHRPVSRNPFLDTANKSNQPPQATGDMSTTAEPEKKTAMASAEEIFDTLTLDDKKPSPPPVNGSMGPPPPREGAGPSREGAGPSREGLPRPRGGPPPMGRRGPPRGENMPPPGRRMPPNHRPTRSQEEALRARRMQGNGNPGLLDPSSPQKRMERRPRRNSESSAMSSERVLTEEERKARDARRRERERRPRDPKEKPRPSRRMDIIDQLDATSIFGTGLFHHDGPFDALNPNRNRTGSRRAPMQAFPKDSLNNVIGGSGPLNARPDHATFMGNADKEAFKEYNAGLEKTGSSSNMPVFDPLSRGAILHGDESLGLGTSTFLEGTPAARTAVQRREAEKVADAQVDGLARKKSLAQRIRNINRAPRDFQASGRMTNPEGIYSRRSPPANMPMPNATSISMNPSTSESNPFFAEFDSSKGEDTIAVRRVDTGGMKSPSSPKVSLERRATIDANPSPDEAQPKASTGLMARVKSLKGGRRARPADPAAPPPPSKEA